jgi:folate-binding protein YgfZ
MSIQTTLKAASEGNILVDLSHQGLLKVMGDDATPFLQGQLTNDVTFLDANKSHLTGGCNPKGRLLALFLAYKHQGAIYLEFDAASLPSIMKRLSMFVMRSKVVIEDASSTVRFGVAGEKATDALGTIFDKLPENAGETISQGESTIIRLPFIKPAFEIITSAEEADKIKTSLTKDLTIEDAVAWDWLAVQSAIPNITTETKEAFVPQMVNLDVLAGINFKKGCYTGQEIVARTHYLGKVKRRTLLAHIETSELPKSGETIWDAAQQNIGQVVRVSPALASGVDVLFEARLDSIEDGKLNWKGNTLTLKTMPYSLEYEK